MRWSGGAGVFRTFSRGTMLAPVPFVSVSSTQIFAIAHQL